MLAATLAVTLLRFFWLALQPAGLYPDEAQYWLWSRHLAFGYYSKPPLVAWAIALTTTLFGDGPFAIRLAAPLCHAIAAAFIYGIGARLYDRRVGFWAGLAYLTLPGVSVSGFVISTDALLLPCWAAALYTFIRAREAAGLWWAAVGLAVGLGLLAKYAMGYWLLSAFGFLFASRAERRHLPPFLAACALALLLYLPNLWWNWANGFASYLHLRDNADLAGPLFHPLELGEFLASQFAVFGPFFFALLLWLIVMPRRLTEPPAGLLAAFALPTLAIILMVSYLSRAHANWAAPAYVSASVLVVAVALDRGWRWLPAASVALHLAVVALVFAGPPALAALGRPLPARWDPLHRLRGWRTLGTEVGAVLAAHPGYRLLADDRETLAALVYYVRPHPFDAVHWNPQRTVKNEWDLTNDLARYPGGNFVVVSPGHIFAELEPAFASVERLPPLVIGIGPGGARRYALYLARGFTGYPHDRRLAAPGRR
ncbi:MAG TPA: glycosyltransferase family 39 protein [Stellaceae bacterium]|nr:glycosyltransferase family 39 protein [Stellaceae bacterium]